MLRLRLIPGQQRESAGWHYPEPSGVTAGRTGWSKQLGYLHRRCESGAGCFGGAPRRRLCLRRESLMFELFFHCAWGSSAIVWLVGFVVFTWTLLSKIPGLDD